MGRPTAGRKCGPIPSPLTKRVRCKLPFLSDANALVSGLISMLRGAFVIGLNPIDAVRENIKSSAMGAVVFPFINHQTQKVVKIIKEAMYTGLFFGKTKIGMVESTV